MKAELGPMHRKLVEAVSGEQLMSYTRQLTEEVRLSGSEEELRAFHRAQTFLENMGLETTLSFHDGYISLPVLANLRIGEKELSCITHSMSVSTGDAGMEGELLYIDTLHPKMSAEGKIVLTEGIATPGGVDWIEQAGAIGAIFINGPITHEMTVSRVWGNPTPQSERDFPAIPVVSVTEKEGVMLRKQAKKAGSSTIWLFTEVDTGWRKIPTLIAEIKGEVEPEKFVLFSGHIDSWHYGAMDNGGANAAMLEVARVMTDQQVKLRRSLRIVFWSGHSHGRYAGSTYYNDTHWEDLHDNCVLHVYIDSIGGKGASILGESNCMAETRDFGGSFVEALTGEVFTGKRFGRGGDQSFWGPGVPALFMGLSEQPKGNDMASQTLVKIFGGVKSGGFGWWWHTTEDTLDKLDPKNLQRDCRVYTAVLYDACTRKLVPLNHAAGVKELRTALEKYADLAGDKLDFQVALERVKKLEELAERINTEVMPVDWTDVQAKRINEKLMAVSHLLIPLNFVSGDLYEQDLAMNQPVLPLLKDTAILADPSLGAGKVLEWQTFLKRRLNKVTHKLVLANREMESLLEI